MLKNQHYKIKGFRKKFSWNHLALRSYLYIRLANDEMAHHLPQKASAPRVFACASMMLVRSNDIVVTLLVLGLIMFAATAVATTTNNASSNNKPPTIDDGAAELLAAGASARTPTGDSCPSTSEVLPIDPYMIERTTNGHKLILKLKCFVYEAGRFGATGRLGVGQFDAILVNKNIFSMKIFSNKKIYIFKKWRQIVHGTESSMAQNCHVPFFYVFITDCWSAMTITSVS